jgi:hypothetical protein
VDVIMNAGRVARIVFSAGMVTFFGWLLIEILSKNQCHQFAVAECYILWGTAIASILGGVLVIETLLARKKTQKASSTSKRVSPSEKSRPPILGMWSSSIVRIALISLLVSMPWFIQGVSRILGDKRKG